MTGFGRSMGGVLLLAGLFGCFEGPAGLDQAFQLDAPAGVRAGSVARIQVRSASMDPRATFRFSSVDGVVEAEGQAATFHAPKAGTNAVVHVVMLSEGVPEAHDSVMIAVYEQIVILKADDLTHDAARHLSDNWHSFLAFARSADLHVGVGLIGQSLETGSAAYIADARQIAADPRFEIWNHGYDHVLGATRPDGTRFSEFSGTSVEHQVRHMRRTQALAREVLGVTPRAFGAPGNAIDSNTVLAISQVPELDIWFYGRPTGSKVVLSRQVEIENPIFQPDYERFVETYAPDAAYLALQIHPGAWDSARLAEFERIIGFLRDRNVAFMTPGEFALVSDQPR